MHFSSQSKLRWNETIVTLGLQKKFYYLIALKQIESEIINQKDNNNKINYFYRVLKWNLFGIWSI